ncbi:MAG: NAD(P)H-hydrate dehydratase [Endomicrobium sp.]|jgi:NAD(P)H-hydrate epimerase|nr:NAD(P)H-hydrate dehydratase [Endomicrobium sp.]
MNAAEIKKFVLSLERPKDSNKYDYGHILVVAGSKNTPGAGVLCANGAMRAGAGLATYSCEENFLTQAASMSKPETMFLTYKSASDIIDFIKSRKVAAAAFGPGLCLSWRLSGFVDEIISEVDIPVVLDASALTAYGGKAQKLKNAKAKLILTPHAGEFNKLCAGKDLVADTVKNFAKQNSLTCLLKGHNTVVSDGDRVYINGSGTPAMATAGSGDVLSGIIAAFAARGFVPFEAAKFGAYVHGLAGELAQKDKGANGIIASDICENIPYILKRLASE